MFQGLFVDGFAGGGGASTGIARAIGRDVDIAINHDPMAIAVHKANHPTTEHHCQDIRIVWPTAATRHREVGGVWFSPDCKEHSKAKGGPVKDRNIRQLPWEIIPWLKDTRPNVGFVENVEEMQQWGPLDEHGHVIKERKGEEFERWVRAIRALGYRVEWRELRACDYGAPTSRKRLYIVFVKNSLKRPVRWPKPTHGRPDSPGVRAGKLLPYRTAAECIDWSIPCPSIFDRARPLKPNTERRIAHGVMRYVVNAAAPFIIPVTHAGDARSHAAAEPLRMITTANGGEFAAVDATIAPLEAGFVAGTAYTNTRASRVFDPADPLRTTTAQADHAVAHVSLAPHVTKFHSGSTGSNMGDPMPTVTGNGEPARPAGATPLGVVGATLVGVGGRRAQSPPLGVDVPAPTGTSKADTAIAGATLVQIGYGEAPGQAPRVPGIDKPLGTIVQAGKHAIVTGAMAPLQNGERRPGEKPREQDIRAPLSTIATGGKHAAISAFLSTFYTTGGKHAVDEPTPTVTADGNHHAVVCAHMEQANTGMVGHDARKPLSTIVGKGCTQRIVETTMIEEGALPPELMSKATRVAAFLIKYYGTATGEAVDQPIGTVTTKDRYAVVTVTIDAVTYVIVDIGMRMLTPRELARAQGFPEDYILAPITPQLIRGKIVHKPLTIAQQIRMIGNSVCPDVAAALVAENCWSGEMRMAA